MIVIENPKEADIAYKKSAFEVKFKEYIVKCKYIEYSVELLTLKNIVAIEVKK